MNIESTLNLTPINTDENKNLLHEPAAKVSPTELESLSGIKLFFRAFKFWLITPMSVSWEEAKRRAQK
jgi:hypothetical protein